jgi:hypothetical protein
VTGLLQLYVENDGIFRGCSLGTNAKGSFPSSDNRSKGILDSVHSELCETMTVSSLRLDIWVSYTHSPTQGENDKARPFRKEGYNFLVQ